jgi:hypothetical protein
MDAWHDTLARHPLDRSAGDARGVWIRPAPGARSTASLWLSREFLARQMDDGPATGSILATAIEDGSLTRSGEHLVAHGPMCPATWAAMLCDWTMRPGDGYGPPTRN